MAGVLSPGAGGRARLVGATLAVALLLTALPVPQWAEPWRPPWVLLVLLYWYLALPGSVGLGVAWLAGLLVDVLHGALLGQHAVAFTLVGYLAVLLHLRIRPFPLGQQALMVAALVLLASAAGQLVQWLAGTISAC